MGRGQLLWATSLAPEEFDYLLGPIYLSHSYVGPVADIEMVVVSVHYNEGLADVSPLSQEDSLWGEDLDPPIRVVCNVDESIVVRGDSVGEHELTLPISLGAPLPDEIQIPVESGDPSIAVAVGHVELFFGAEGDVGARAKPSGPWRGSQ